MSINLYNFAPENDLFRDIFLETTLKINDSEEDKRT